MVVVVARDFGGAGRVVLMGEFGGGDGGLKVVEVRTRKRTKTCKTTRITLDLS